MTNQVSCEIRFQGEIYLVKAHACEAEPEAGLPRPWFEDHAIFSLENGERLESFEDALSQREWENLEDVFEQEIWWGVDHGHGRPSND